MRMTCPNCSAQYEVDANVIPEVGRDVQCSNCGHTWFQRQSRQEAEQEITQAAPLAEPVSDQRDPDTMRAPDEQPAPAPEPDDSTAMEQAPAAQTMVKRALDDGVAGILREEAERETNERAVESSSLETQQDLGLDQVPQDSVGKRQEHVAQIQSAEKETHSQSNGENSRRDLLPDIEEINSTLAASTEQDEYGEETAEHNRRGGFRRGFTFAIVVFAIMALVYVFAPKIAEIVPQSASALIWYVEWINGLRTAVDNMMLGAIERLTTLLAQLSGESGA